MCHASWITKFKNAHIEYKTLISFPQQQELHEQATKLSNGWIRLGITTVIANPFTAQDRIMLKCSLLESLRYPVRVMNAG